MRARKLILVVFGFLAFTAAMGAIGALRLAMADDGVQKDPLEWATPRYGFSWKKPDDPLWVWVPEEKWGGMFQGGTKPENLVAALAKFGVPGGEQGKDAEKILILVWRYVTEGKLKVGEKDFDPLNIKGMAEEMWSQDKEGFKDIRNPKPPAQCVRYKFDNKIINWSFTGINKVNGQTGFHENMLFKGNSKYVFQINVNCPSQDERVVRQELDRVLNAIKIDKPK